MNRECNVTKRVLTRNGLRYCPVVLSAKWLNQAQLGLRYQ
jgi:hypothetical protein